MGNKVLADVADTNSERCMTINVRKGFYDEDRGPGTQHVGAWPTHLEQFTQRDKFREWLLKGLDDLAYLSEKTRQDPAAEPGQLHLLFWRNRGTHRSVSATRVFQVVASELKLAGQPVCIYSPVWFVLIVFTVPIFIYIYI